MSKFAGSSKNCEKLEKLQFLLKLLNSSGKGGRRVPSKNCDLCEECGYDLGGTNQPAPKKPKRNCPSAVLFVGSSHFSCKTSTKDDRCFFIKEGESVFCSQQQCMDARTTFVSSGRAANLSCKHAYLKGGGRLLPDAKMLLIPIKLS